MTSENPRPTAPESPAPAGPRARLTVAPKPATPEDDLFATPDDGFGPDPFPTAAAADPLPQPQTAPPATALTARQLRLARRLAARHGLSAPTEAEALRLLREAGIDPFQRSPVAEAVAGARPDPAPATPAAGGPAAAIARLPRPVTPIAVPIPAPLKDRAEVNHAAEIQRMQQDLVRRRRRRSAFLALRLFLFVFLPTVLSGWYFYAVATPLYATKSEFVIQTAAAPTAHGGSMGGLQSSPMANMMDSIAVQGYLQSREAMLRLDRDLGFRAHFTGPAIDPVQRLDPGATAEAAYRLYQRNVRIAYDPTEGIVRMEVIAPNPALSAQFARALIGYAEEQVDHLTQRMREDSMRGALESHREAEADLLAARQRVVALQERFKMLSSEAEVGLVTGQIGLLEGQMTTERLALAQMQSNAHPNPARTEPIKRRIATLQSQIADLRARLVRTDAAGESLARIQSDLRMAEAEAQTRQTMLAQTLQTMELARIEANRQARYISVSVSPVAPDEATYPRAFENTMVALLVFAGIYLLISMTAAILREQVSA